MRRPSGALGLLLIVSLLATACTTPATAALIDLASAGAGARQASTQEVHLPGVGNCPLLDTLFPDVG